MDKNKFCDMRPDEFVRINTGIRGRPKKDVHEGYNYPVPSGDSFVSTEIGTRITSNTVSQGGSSRLAQVSSGGSSYNSKSSSLPVSPKSSSSSSSSSLPVSPKEFKNSASAQGQQSGNMTNVFMPSSSLESQVEDEVDWRKEGAVTPVKNQGRLKMICEIWCETKREHSFSNNFFLSQLPHNFAGKCARYETQFYLFFFFYYRKEHSLVIKQSFIDTPFVVVGLSQRTALWKLRISWAKEPSYR